MECFPGVLYTFWKWCCRGQLYTSWFYFMQSCFNPKCSLGTIWPTFTWMKRKLFNFKVSIHHASMESRLFDFFLHFVVISGIWVDLQNILPYIWVRLLSIVQWLRDIAKSNNIVNVSFIATSKFGCNNKFTWELGCFRLEVFASKLKGNTSLLDYLSDRMGLASTF